MNEVHPTNKNEVAWSSWLPAVGFALARSTGPVLEIGIGHFSTPFLHEYCKGANRALFSIESDDGWRNEFKARYATPLHSFGPLIFGDHLGVVFIDNSPGGEARANPFRMWLNHADFIVVHDYHRENEEAIKPLLEGVNYRIFSDYNPPTLLASLKHPVQ
jgi:hypothetical protein